MADTAAHLVDRVFPRVPVRQWVLTFPYALRYPLAYDASLLTDVLGIFTKTIFTSLIRRAREFGADRNVQCGAVSFIQRFDSALRLNLHIHSLIIDGVYAADDDDKPQFQALPAPADEEIAQLTQLLAERIGKFLEKRGLGPGGDPEESEPLARDQPASTSGGMRAMIYASMIPECRVVISLSGWRMNAAFSLTTTVRTAFTSMASASTPRSWCTAIASRRVAPGALEPRAQEPQAQLT